MAWITSGLVNQNWIFYNTEIGMTRDNNETGMTSSLFYRKSPSRTYSQGKNYKFITTVKNFRRGANSIINDKFLEIQAPWGLSFSYATASTTPEDTRPHTFNSFDLNFYSSPLNTTTSTNRVEYKSTYDGFGNSSSDGDGVPVITNFKLIEIDWFINGWALNDSDPRYRGWTFLENDNSIRWRNNALNVNSRNPIGATSSNLISRFVSYPKFNISFDVTLSGGGVDVYMSEERFDLNNEQFLGRIDSSTNNIIFYDIIGNRNLTFRADYDESSTNSITISNFLIDGSYHPSNNSQFTFDNIGNDLVINGATGATYSTIIVGDNTIHGSGNDQFGATGTNDDFNGFFSNLYGTVSGLNSLNSKMGNGLFKSGIWENGVWNSGWRVDEYSYDFLDIVSILQVNTKNNTWRVQIKGNTSSVSQFEIGDNVSIGNIIGIDINENRTILRGFYTIINKDNNNIVIELMNVFPLRRIEKDSKNHKIKITKNVWLNGAFFNGYFEGVWNNGLFKGFPFITEMYNSHWIDGYFDGGHFYADYPTWEFNSVFYNANTAPNSLGLSGIGSHDLETGDIIEIELGTSSVNEYYNGEAKVIDILTDNSIVVNKVYGLNGNEFGNVNRKTGTGVIQHFNFNDNNISDKFIVSDTGQPNIKSIYNYNSWINVKYIDESATNLNREQVNISNGFGFGFEFSRLNLYGYITDDVLSSESFFRNSWNLSRTKYSLGTKYKIYDDFLGPISEFNEPFRSGNMDNFFDNGWTYSTNAPSNYDLITDENSNFIIRNPTSSNIIRFNNENINIEKNRYSLIEFDLLSFQSSSDNFSTGEPFINFFNRPTDLQGNGHFPISENVFHTRTGDRKKYEYFYNRKSLDMFLFNQDSFTASFDNLKYYEVDMIPFFQYTTEEFINNSVQVPYQGIAPNIDYGDSGFSFISNIDIRLDSLSTQQSMSVPTSTSGGTLISNQENLINIQQTPLT